MEIKYEHIELSGESGFCNSIIQRFGNQGGYINV